MLYRQRARRRPTAREPPGQRIAHVPALQRSPRAPKILEFVFVNIFEKLPSGVGSAGQSDHFRVIPLSGAPQSENPFKRA